MSDFDKEKERQRLREKYERDEAKRRSTQRMSELLLKGATMTNKHCDQCGDPLFRYEGQVFCPTCQTEGQVAASADQGTESAAQDTESAAQDTESAAQDTESAAQDTESANQDIESAAKTVETADAQEATSIGAADAAASSASASSQEDTTKSEERRTQPNKRETESDRTPSDSPPKPANSRVSPSTRTARGTNEYTRRDVDGDVASARESLVRTLTWAAERAESTDDPRRTAEYLAAAREAAEAIAALDR